MALNAVDEATAFTAITVAAREHRVALSALARALLRLVSGTAGPLHDIRAERAAAGLLANAFDQSLSVGTRQST
jgi:hypothetical protein